MTERSNALVPSHSQRHPPDVEEALSSMLWTPYERTPTESSAEEDDELPNREKSVLCRSQSNWDQRTTSANHQQQQHNRYSSALQYLGSDSFSTYILSNCTTTDDFDNSRQHSMENHQQKDFVHYNYRYSNPYFGPLPNLNKWWSSSTSNTKELPSYESLYAFKSAFPNTLSTTSSTTALKIISPHGNNNNDNMKPNFNGTISNGILLPPVTPPYDFGAQELQHVADETCCAMAKMRDDNITTATIMRNEQVNKEITNVRSQQNRENQNNCVNENVHNNNNSNEIHQQHVCEREHKGDENVRAEIEEEIDHSKRERVNQLDSTSMKDNSRAIVASTKTAAAAAAKTTTINTSSTASFHNGESFSVELYNTLATNHGKNLQTYSNKATTTRTTSSTSISSNEFVANEVSVFCEPLTTQAISSTSAFEVNGLDCEPLSVFANVLPYTLRSLASSPPPSYFGSVEDNINLIATFATPSLTSSSADDSSTTNTLTPNKCLAELERLYAEFHASESAFEQRQKIDPVDSDNNSDSVNNNNNKNNTNNNYYIDSPARNQKFSKMRLSIPASTATTTTTTLNVDNNEDVVVGGSTPIRSDLTTSPITNNNNNNNNNSFTTTSENYNNNNSNNNNKSSNVAILTTPTKSTSSCQRHPSLTIQVNNNNNNNNNNNYSNNNNSSISNIKNYTKNHNNNPNNFYSNKNIQSIGSHNNNNNINNNCVSVVNCAYVQANINNNNNDKIYDSANNNANIAREKHKFINNNNNNMNMNKNDSDSNNVSIVPTSATSVSVTMPTRGTISKFVDNEIVEIDSNVWNNVKNNATSDIVNVININNTNDTFTTINDNNNSNINNNNIIPSTSGVLLLPSRTFTSTECQTDDVVTPNNNNNLRNSNSFVEIDAASHMQREQRRRDRRERRQQRQDIGGLIASTHRRLTERHSMPNGMALMAAAPPPPPIPNTAQMLHHHATTATMPAAMSALLRPMLPDILHNHYPPPYSALSLNSNILHNGAPNPHSLPPPPPPPPLLTPVISTVPIPGATQIVPDGRFSLPLPIIRRTPSERSGKGCCGQWFAGPPLRALIAVVALGGVACALGGAALGVTGLTGTPNSHMTAALLMIGVGVVLVTVSGAAWRMTAPGGPPCLGLGSGVDLGRCGRRPCSRGGGAPHGLLYPEFQHRPPPPSYQASMQEYRLRLLLLDRDRQSNVVRGGSPPPTYRSHAGSLLRAPLTMRGGGGGSSSVGGSEYSLPPSYRLRNATPATVSSDNSIEVMPSGRLLANEDLPKPFNGAAVQLSTAATLDASTAILTPKITTTTTSSPSSTTTTTQIGTGSGHQVRTAAVVEIEDRQHRMQNVNEKDFGNDLVTIVTISQNAENVDVTNASRANKDQIEILAHL